MEQAPIPEELDVRAFFKDLDAETAMQVLPEASSSTRFDLAGVGNMTAPDASPLDFAKLTEWLLSPFQQSEGAF